MHNALVSVDANGRFTVGGVPFVPQGVNAYSLLLLAGQNRMDDVRQVFEQAHALRRPLIRTNAFFDGGTNVARMRNDDATLHEPGLVGLDRLLAAAAAANVRLVLTLTNNWHDFGGAHAVLRAVAPTEHLPKDAFWTDPRAIHAQRMYIDALVQRINTVNGRAYRKDPTIFAWELANEARCESGPTSILTNWARTMSVQLRVSGAEQLVSWGGMGYRNSYGENAELLMQDGAIDVFTLHLYPLHRFRTQSERAHRSRAQLAALLGAARIREAARIARKHRSALLIEEFGWAPRTSDPDTERATVYTHWLRAADDEKIGTLPWMIGESARMDNDGFLLRLDREPKTAHALGRT